MPQNSSLRAEEGGRKRKGLLAIGAIVWIAAAIFPAAILGSLLTGPPAWAQECLLCKAAAEGDPAKISRLLEEGANPNQADEQGNSALLHAVFHGKDESVKILLACGADPHRKNAAGFAASSSADEKIGQILSTPPGRCLIEKIASDRANGETEILCPLCEAVKKGNVEIVRLLLDSGYDPRETDESGRTAVDYAVLGENVELVRMLTGAQSPPRQDQIAPLDLKIEERVPTSAPDLESEKAAFESALAANNVKDWLDFLDSVGEQSEHSKKARAKIKQIIEARHRRGRTALHNAAKHGDAGQVELLLRAGADANAISKRDETPLMFAAEESNIRIVEMLLEAGANKTINHRDRNRKSAIDWARGKNKFQIVQMLRANGAVDRRNVRD